MQKKTGCANARRFDEANQKNRNRPSKKSYYQKKKLKIKKSWHTEKKPISKKGIVQLFFHLTKKLITA
jgi:hypothetical protein